MATEKQPLSLTSAPQTLSFCDILRVFGHDWEIFLRKPKWEFVINFFPCTHRVVQPPRERVVDLCAGTRRSGAPRLRGFPPGPHGPVTLIRQGVTVYGGGRLRAQPPLCASHRKIPA